MTDRHYEYLIIGGGLVASAAVKELVKLGAGGTNGQAGGADRRIAVLCEEAVPPYDRPPLSKNFLLGDLERDSIFVLREEFCRDNGVDLLLGNAAISVDTAARVVTAADGSRLTYGKLLIASGCHLRRLSIPGAELPGLYYLRTLDEAEALRAAALDARQAVVIGGGFIGLEVSSVLAQLDLSVSVIHRADRLMEKFRCDELSTFFEELFHEHGVHIVYDDEAASLHADGGNVDRVLTKVGRILPCDLAVAGIGVWPDTGYLEGSGLDLGNGVKVNEYLEALVPASATDSGQPAEAPLVPDVYAAGDIANFFDLTYGKQRRIEHWDTALRQGKLAGANMAAASAGPGSTSAGREAYRRVSYFYSTVFGLTYECMGDMTEFDEVVTRGSFEDRSATVLYLKEGVLRSALLLGRPREERRTIDELITSGQRLEAVVSRLGS